MKIKKYMHLLNDKPAFFQDEQIVYAGSHINLWDLPDTLEQLRREQVKSENYRNKHFGDENIKEHDYLIVYFYFGEYSNNYR